MDSMLAASSAACGVRSEASTVMFAEVGGLAYVLASGSCSSRHLLVISYKLQSPPS